MPAVRSLPVWACLGGLGGATLVAVGAAATPVIGVALLAVTLAATARDARPASVPLLALVVAWPSRSPRPPSAAWGCFGSAWPRWPDSSSAPSCSTS